MKIWTCGSSPRSGSRNAWTRIRNVNGTSRHSNFWDFFCAIQMISCRVGLVTIDETWLYHYDAETKQQSMEWRHSGSPRPQKFRVQKPAGEVLACLDFLGSRRHPPHRLSSEWSKLSTRCITHLCWCNRRKFWGKNAMARSPRWSCSCTTMPRLTGHLQPIRNWPTWASNILITHTILRIWPRRTTICSFDWKNNWNVAIFRSTRRSLLPRRPGWTDNVLNIFWVACKS